MRIAAKEEAPHSASWLVVSPCRGRGCRSTDSASLRIRQAATQVFIQEAIAPLHRAIYYMYYQEEEANRSTQPYFFSCRRVPHSAALLFS
ncbi:hypothetical protein GQ600_12537 [Phytophthora cactorum]|nr:hypothetical protein GQ600_12537 [Phytophthora cactorum]